MADDDDYIDELNWYTEDFSVKSKSKTKKRDRTEKNKDTDKERDRKSKRHEKTRFARVSKPSRSTVKKTEPVPSISKRPPVVSKSSHSIKDDSKKISLNDNFKSKLFEPIRALSGGPETDPFKYVAKSVKSPVQETDPYKFVAKNVKHVFQEMDPFRKPVKSVKSETLPPKTVIKIATSPFQETDPLAFKPVVKSIRSSILEIPTPSKSESKVKSEPVKVAEPLTGFTKLAVNTKAMQLLSTKLALLEERDKLIRSSLEKPSNLKQARAIKGTCPDMCPEKERIMRSLKKMVSVFECAPDSNEMDPKLAVKEYARSSADQEEPLPHDLRPEPVLTMAMAYIVNNILSKFEECEDMSAWYDFCWNRLRAIRKDIVQQQLCDLETVTIVEQCARFHIVCFDRFWAEDSSVFDEKINTENLMNCLKILLNLYADLRKQGASCPNEPEFNAYMILIKMNSGDLLWEYLNFPLYLQQAPEVIEAVKIHMFYNSNMYSQFFNYLNRTTYLNACLMQRCFTQLRVRALETLVKAYCPPNKEGKISLQHIVKSLKFDTKEDALAFCRSCNIRYVERAGFKISHSIFTRPEVPHKIKTPSLLVCNKRIDFAQAVVGIYNDMPHYIEHRVHNSFISDKSLHPDAIDASDQEEKMLRDDVERKILLKSLKGSPVKDSHNNSNIASPPSLHRSLSSPSGLRKSLEAEVSSARQVERLSFSPEPDDVDMEEDMSENEDYDMPDAPAIPVTLPQAEPEQQEEEEDVVFEDAENDDSSTYNKEEELRLFLNTQQVSPLSAISDTSEPAEEPPEEIATLPSHSPSESEGEPEYTSDSPPSPVSVSPPLRVELPKELPRKNVSPPLPSPSERRLSAALQHQHQPPKASPFISKMRSKLRLNFQRLSAKKYARIWRDKVRELRKSYGFVPLVSHMNVKEYLNVWGSTARHDSIWNRLTNTKKLSSSVDSLLLFDLFRISPDKLIYPLCEKLVDKKLKFSNPFERIYDSGPVYWKLVISVPSSNSCCYDLYEQVDAWSEQMFFTSEVAKRTRVETLTCNGIKVHCKVMVSEGLEKIDNSANLSALVMLRVAGWESNHETQDRLSKMLSLANHPIPVCVIDLSQSTSLLSKPSSQSVTCFNEVASSSANFSKILGDLASNSYRLSVKSLHVCDLMSETLDKFIDSLQNDMYNSVGVEKALSDPTTIIYIYNALIEKIKNEIVSNYKSKIFGTANEILSAITTNSKYNICSVPSIISDYFDSLMLCKLEWPPSSSDHLLEILKKYCDRLGIPQVLSHVIRMINPPDDGNRSEEDLSSYLKHLHWLHIMEVVIKSHFRTKFCDILVTYSEKSLNDTVDSHWWMESNTILKHCNS